LIVTSTVVAGFVGSVLAPTFEDSCASPEFHKEMWEYCCSSTRWVAICAPRGHAKTTAVTLGYGLATLLFRERKFMLLVSNTEQQAALFLGNIKQQLQTNDTLIELFGIKRQQEDGKVKFIKDSETDIIVEFDDGKMFRIIAKGSEQKVRGLTWGTARPDLIICDDMENDEQVMNKDRREKFKRWFTGALLPCMSDRGIIRMVGTILHMDSMLENLMPKPYAKDRAGRPTTITKDLKQYSIAPNKWLTIKYRAHTDDFKKLLWPEKKTVEFFRLERQDHFERGIQDVYSQEYLNIPIDESSTYFRRADFKPMHEDDFKKIVTYYIAVDLAISEKETADYSVFVVGAVDEDKHLQIRNVIRERMDGREIVDTLLWLQKMYKPEAIGIEEMQVSKAIGPFFREEMVKNNNYVSTFLLKHGGKDKLARSRSIQARMRANGVKFDKSGDWYPIFEEECMRFPRDRHDDQVDAFAYLGMMLDIIVEAPTKDELEEDAYLEEYEKSGLSMEGQSSITGY
jgi:predicted phage terminase large subunit-like protein